MTFLQIFILPLPNFLQAIAPCSALTLHSCGSSLRGCCGQACLHGAIRPTGTASQAARRLERLRPQPSPPNASMNLISAPGPLLARAFQSFPALRWHGITFDPITMVRKSRRSFSSSYQFLWAL